MAAVRKVFNTFELLEEILSHLSALDIIFASRKHGIGKCFDDVFTRSSVVRNKLFLPTSEAHTTLVTELINFNLGLNAGANTPWLLNLESRKYNIISLRMGGSVTIFMHKTPGKELHFVWLPPRIYDMNKDEMFLIWQGVNPYVSLVCAFARAGHRYVELERFLHAHCPHELALGKMMASDETF